MSPFRHLLHAWAFLLAVVPPPAPAAAGPPAGGGSEHRPPGPPSASVSEAHPAFAPGLLADSVTIYQMELPYNTTIGSDVLKGTGRFQEHVASWATKRRWVDEAFEALQRAGYTVGSAYTAVRNPDRTKFVYRDRLWQGADLLGLGVSSFSHVGGTHFQNQHDFEPYLADLRQGRLPVFRALTPSSEERLIRELVLQMKLGRVNHRRLGAKYGVDVLTRFSAPIAGLREQGFLSVDPEWLCLSREGLLQVDRLVHEFFLPAHREARYA